MESASGEVLRHHETIGHAQQAHGSWESLGSSQLLLLLFLMLEGPLKAS